MSVTIINNSASEVLFSVFKDGDSGVPCSYKWIKGGGEKDTLDTGPWQAICIGAQMQSGGVWVGGDPKFGPNGTPGQTYTFDVSRSFKT